MALIVEVVDSRGGTVKARVRLDGASLSVGRGFDNDLILDDPYVDARHARMSVSSDGEVEIEDLGSINGLVVVNEPGRVPRVNAGAGTQVRIGRTILRFRDPAEPVPAALPDAIETNRIARLLGDFRARAAICIAALGLLTGYVWLGSYERDSGSAVAALSVMFVLFGVTWAGMWAIASRALVSRFNFTAHLTMVALITVPAVLFTSLESWAAFIVPDGALLTPFSVLAWTALFTAALALHLSLSSTMDRMRRWRAAAITVGGLVLTGGLLAWAGRDVFTDVPVFSGVVKPVYGRMLPTMEVSGFSDVVAELTRQTDELAGE
jgi:hypothetical protein